MTRPEEDTQTRRATVLFFICACVALCGCGNDEHHTVYVVSSVTQMERPFIAARRLYVGLPRMLVLATERSAALTGACTVMFASTDARRASRWAKSVQHNSKFVSCESLRHLGHDLCRERISRAYHGVCPYFSRIARYVIAGVCSYEVFTGNSSSHWPAPAPCATAGEHSGPVGGAPAHGRDGSSGLGPGVHRRINRRDTADQASSSGAHSSYHSRNVAT